MMNILPCHCFSYIVISENNFFKNICLHTHNTQKTTEKQMHAQNTHTRTHMTHIHTQSHMHDLPNLLFSTRHKLMHIFSIQTFFFGCFFFFFSSFQFFVVPFFFSFTAADMQCLKHEYGESQTSITLLPLSSTFRMAMKPLPFKINNTNNKINVYKRQSVSRAHPTTTTDQVSSS